LWYALEVHDVPDIILNDIKSILQTFIWNTFHQRDLNSLTLPYEEGGLSLQNIDIKIQALRIRWLARMYCEKNEKNSQKTVINLLIDRIDQVSGLKILLYDLSYRRIKHTFYSNSYRIWLANKITYKPGSLQEIKYDYIYENNILRDDENKTFKKLPDYNSVRRMNLIPKFFKDLPLSIPIGGLTESIKRLIISINRAYFNITPAEKHIFLIKNEEKETDLLSLNFKETYMIILSKQKFRKIWEPKWNQKLNRQITKEEWSKIWMIVNHSMINYRVQSSIWEMIHRNFITNYSLKKMNRSDGICKLCHLIEEDRCHIFTTCNVINSLYRHFSAILLQLYPNQITNEEKIFGIYIEKTPKIELRNYITFFIRHTVYRNRNTDFISSDIINTLRIKIIKAIDSDIISKFNIAKMKRELDKFKNVFLIGEILAKIQENTLISNLI